MNPYILLNVDQDANDETIENAYLKAARAYPPEKNPEMFEAVRGAFDAIATDGAKTRKIN